MTNEVSKNKGHPILPTKERHTKRETDVKVSK